MNKDRWMLLCQRIKEHLPPDPYGFSWIEILRICLGVNLIFFAIMLMNLWIAPMEHSEPVNAVFLVTTLMTFLMPSSPLFHPKVILEGNLIASLVTSTCSYVVSSPNELMILATISSTLVMHILGCFCPTALMLALFMAAGKVQSYSFAFFPVLLDCLVLVVCAYFFGRLTKKPYPMQSKKY